jgi:hypothetical protein
MHVAHNYMLENCQYGGEISIEIRKGNGLELPLDAKK